MPKPRTTKTSSAIERERRRLEEEQAQLRLAQEQLGKLIETAPRKREKIKRLERERVMKVAVESTRHRGAIPVPSHPRYGDTSTTRSKRSLTLKKDRRLMQMKFIALCIILGTILLLLWRTLPA